MSYGLISGTPGLIVGTSTMACPELDTDYTAASAIPAGALVELTAGGQLQAMQQTGATCRPFGLCIQTVAAGAQVFVLRKGRAFVSWAGSATAAYNVAPNIAHSSTTATTRGFLTDAATSTTAGSEVSAAPGAITVLRNTSATAGFTGVVLCDLNFPAS